jgi:hypothetical protein
MGRKIGAVILLALLMNLTASAQLKFIIEDFEGLAAGQDKFPGEGIYTYGSAMAVTDKSKTTGKGYSGSRCMKIGWNGSTHYGGWGKGVGLNVQLDASTDHINFYVLNQGGKNETRLNVTITEDDNGNAKPDEHDDDTWVSEITIEPKNEWQLVSIPLSSFKDNNNGGDGVCNISYKDGQLLTFALGFKDGKKLPVGAEWYFDFICFSKGALPTGSYVFDPPAAQEGDFCLLGAWSDVGYDADFTLISNSFNDKLRTKEQRLGVIHFFMPLASDGGKHPNTYPNVNRLNMLLAQGQTPMITMELQYVQVGKRVQQPNLYTVIEGHLDDYFIRWAKTIKQVNGVVLIRLMHEFNGDWYPWCIVNNDKRPELYIKAFQHIHDIFKSQDALNAKFIWCPNSRSFPQEGWNYVMDAYPGDAYVDYVGLDVYNGAHGGLWRSFRREIIENYFLFTTQLAHKPLLVCETASREREGEEKGDMQDKAAWIGQMSEALKTDLAKVRLLNWFDQYKNFKINSSGEAREAYITAIWKDAYFVPQSHWFFK